MSVVKVVITGTEGEIKDIAVSLDGGNVEWKASSLQDAIQFIANKLDCQVKVNTKKTKTVWPES